MDNDGEEDDQRGELATLNITKQRGGLTKTRHQKPTRKQGKCI
ncbi:hypothetical protein BVRB_4g076520 [Beta vulgaris subsp. vulgaris]|nr:hypothetical protein BVRB_4g076520 [Beta vulgaris subsp. vulgaris]